MTVSKADVAVAHVLNAIRDDGRKAYLMGLGTQTFTLLTDAYAASKGIDPQKFREDFWAQCTPERVVRSA